MEAFETGAKDAALIMDSTVEEDDAQRKTKAEPKFAAYSAEYASKLEDLLTKVRRDQDEWNKILALESIQQDWQDLFEYPREEGARPRWSSCTVKRLDLLVKVGKVMVEKPLSRTSGRTDWVRGQVLVCLTNVFISLDVLEVHPVLFFDLTVILWGFASCPNGIGDARTRQLACECLREIELCYPSALGDLVSDILPSRPWHRRSCLQPFSLFQCLQIETSHMRQSYASLLLCVLEHECLMQHLGQNSPIEKVMYKGSSEAPSNPFPSLRLFLDVTIAGNTQLLPNIDRYSHLQPIYLRSRSFDERLSNLGAFGGLHDALSLILDIFPRFSPWCRMEVLHRISNLCSFISVPLDTFSHRLDDCLGRSNSGLFHRALVTWVKLSNQCDRLEEKGPFLTSRCVQVLQSAAFTNKERILSSLWCQSLLDQNLQWLSPNQQPAFFPQGGDLTSVQVAFFSCLLRSFSEDPHDERGLGSHDDGLRLLDLIRSRICMERFECFYPVSSHESQGGGLGSWILKVTFDLIERSLSRFPYLSVYFADFVCSLVLEHVHTVSGVVARFECFLATQNPQFRLATVDIVERILLSILRAAEQAETLHGLEKYLEFYLFASGIVELSPNRTVGQVLVLLAQNLDDCSGDRERIGETVIDCCEVLLRTHDRGTLCSLSSSNFRIILHSLQQYDEYPLVVSRASELMSLADLPRENDFADLFSNLSPDQDWLDSFSVKLQPVLTRLEKMHEYLKLERSYNEATNDTSLQDLNMPCITGKSNEEVLDVYLEAEKWRGERGLVIPLRLFLVEPIPNLSNPKAPHELIMGIHIELSPERECDIVEPIQLGTLELSSPKKQYHNLDVVKVRSKEFLLRVRPNVPVPVEFKVVARFSCPNGDMMEGSLGTVRLDTLDLFLPLGGKGMEKDKAFTLLWEHRCSLFSVKTIDIANDRSTTALQRSFGKYFISNNWDGSKTLSDSDDYYIDGKEFKHNEQIEVKMVRVGMFIPPESHLLLKVGITQHFSTIRLASDNMFLLAQCDVLFARLFEDVEDR